MKIRLRGRLPKPAIAAGCLDREQMGGEVSPGPLQLAKILKRSLAQADTRLAEKFNAGADVNRLVKARAWVVEQLILEAWNALIGERDDVALIAIGGFGRGELHPHSDVDLLLLLDQLPPDEALREAIEAFVTVLWDAGFYLGHSVRDLDLCVTEAKKDIATATSLMESHLLSGRPQMLRNMLDATSTDEVWSAADFFDAKFHEQITRHEQYNDTAYNLEPNIKEGPGGLRDIQMIGWVAKRRYHTQSLHTLVSRGFLNKNELQQLKKGRTFLWEIRYALHLLSGRGEDRLLFEYQQRVARHFISDETKNPNAAVEAFMQRYYRTVMQLERLNEMLLQLFREQLLPSKTKYLKDLGEDFRITHGYLEVADKNLFKRRPVALLEMSLLLAKNEDIPGVRAATIRLVRDHLYLIDDDFRADPEAIGCFFELLCQPSGVYTQLQRMNRYGILAAFIPAFAKIVGRMQFDLFHAYTVDQHILFVVRNLRRFAYGKYSADFAHGADIFQQVDHPELLYLAALFHDIAKGRDGDHSLLGAKDALAFCRRLPLKDAHRRRVAWLVEQHLVMSQTAQRRDIADPETLSKFCQVVGNQTRLDYLYLLTIADIAATSPKLWNNWKDSLLWELYSAASEALSEGSSNILDRGHRIQEARAHAREKLQRDGFDADVVAALLDSLPKSTFLRLSIDQLEWATAAVLEAPEAGAPLVAVREVEAQGVSELLVHARDYDGLFAAVTAVIDEIGIDVLSARVLSTTAGWSFDLFQLMDRHGQMLNDVDSQRLRARLQEVLGKAAVPVPVVRKLPRRLRPFTGRARIRFSAALGGSMTLMDVECTDRPGLLSQISAVLLGKAVRIHDAKIATFGDRVEDAFIISDRYNAPLDRKLRAELRKALLEMLQQKEI